ncbi:MAG: hypothetical protein AB7O26_16100, partial [Planctomycetaceae bacterium]
MVRKLLSTWLCLVGVPIFFTALPLCGEEPESPVKTVIIEKGDLSVHFRDNSKSPEVLSGLDSLFHKSHAPNYDAFDPADRGASAGLNFEHIISGHKSPHNKFTPRSGPYAL